MALEGSSALHRQMLIEHLQELKQKLGRIEAHLDKIAQSHPGVALLWVIPRHRPAQAWRAR